MTVHILQLKHVAPGDRPQERPQCGRRPDAATQDRHGAVAEQAHVINAVRPGDLPSHQAGEFHLRVHAARPADPDMLPPLGHPGLLAGRGPSPEPSPPATRGAGHQRRGDLRQLTQHQSTEMASQHPGRGRCSAPPFARGRRQTIKPNTVARFTWIRPTKGAGPGQPYFTAVSGPAVERRKSDEAPTGCCSLN